MRATAILGGIFAVTLVAFASTVKVHVVSAATGGAALSVTRAGASDRLVPSIALRPTAPAPLVTLAVPVAGVARSSIADSWGDPRDNGLREHHGTDIAAAAGVPVIAAAPGVVDKLYESSAGGLTIYVRSPDRQWSYYYAHLGGYAPGLHEGQIVQTGEPIGMVGDSGNAGAGNFHLHFGLSRMAPADRWWQGTPIDPYPSLAGKSGPG